MASGRCVVANQNSWNSLTIFPTDVLVMDFAKAFDKVSHGLLLYKLHHYGITGKTNTWIQTFLQDRQQVVALNGHGSDTALVQSGVPKGSVCSRTIVVPILR